MSSTTSPEGNGARVERGFTVMELLVSALIVVLVGTCVAQGVSFAASCYHDAMRQSESRVLLDTLTSILQDELSGTGTVTLGERISGDEYELRGFFNSFLGDSRLCAVAHGADGGIELLEDGEYGELYFLGAGGTSGGRLLVSSANYTEYGFGARIDRLTYDAERNIFHVSLSLLVREGETVESDFDVFLLTGKDSLVVREE